MTRSMKLIPVALLAILAPVVALAQAPAPAAAPTPAAVPTTNPEMVKTFDALTQKVQRDAGTAQPAEIEQMFKLGKQLGRPIAANQAAKNYFTKNLQPPPNILL